MPRSWSIAFFVGGIAVGWAPQSHAGELHLRMGDKEIRKTFPDPPKPEKRGERASPRGVIRRLKSGGPPIPGGGRRYRVARRRRPRSRLYYFSGYYAPPYGLRPYLFAPLPHGLGPHHHHHSVYGGRVPHHAGTHLAIHVR